MDLPEADPPGPEGSFTCGCNEGYDFVGTSAVNDYHCVRTSCGAVPTTANLLHGIGGKLMFDTETFLGDEAGKDTLTEMPILSAFYEITHMCAEGFSTDGGTGPESLDFTVRCTVNGVFSKGVKPDGECQPIRCDDFMLPVVANSVVANEKVESFFEYGDDVISRCVAGFTYNGQKTKDHEFPWHQ